MPETEQWEYKFIAFSPAEVAVVRLDEAGKEGWEAVSHVVEGVRLSVLLKRPLTPAPTESQPDLWADEPDWPELPKDRGTGYIRGLGLIRDRAIVPVAAYLTEDDLQVVTRQYPDNIYFLDRGDQE